MVNRRKETGTKTDEIVNMSDIFKPHEKCPQPRKVLIGGKPGTGKTTYCSKLAYDWATEEGEVYFPKFQVVLLLKCRDINSDLWEAIDDQLVPLDVQKEKREKFFEFIRQNQANVLLVLDGLDELPTSKLPTFQKIIERRMLPKCHLVVTARQEVAIKVGRFFDTLLEIEGFTEQDARTFIVKYFKNKDDLAHKLLENLDNDEDLRDLTANPLNTALLCLLFEDLQGIYLESRTQLYLELVECVLRRYRKKKNLPETKEDLIQVHESELKHLGLIAFNGLLENDMYFEESEFGIHASVIPGFEFLSVQPGASKRRPSLCYGFLHKNFQELFAAFYLSCQLLDDEISPESIVADTRYFEELKQVLLFTCGILAVQSEETAVALIKSMAYQVNNVHDDKVDVALHCIKECKEEGSGLHVKLARVFGSFLQLQSVDVGFVIRLDDGLDVADAATLAEVLKTNTTLTELDVSGNKIGGAGAAALAEAIKTNSTVTRLYMSKNGIGDAGVAALAEAIKINSTATELYLSQNGIGEAGAAALAEAIKTNTTVTVLHLSGNSIGDAGAAALAEAIETNSTVTNLDLSKNVIGDAGAAALAEAIKTNSIVTILNLSHNDIGENGAAALADANKTNSTLTRLNLSHNHVGDAGGTALAAAIKTNSTLRRLALSDNGVSGAGGSALAEAMKVNSTLTRLNLSDNHIGDAGVTALAAAIKTNSTLRRLELSGNKIGDAGGAALAEAIKTNLTLTLLDLSTNDIQNAGCDAFAEAIESRLASLKLYLLWNKFGDDRTAVLRDAKKLNSCIKLFSTELDLSNDQDYQDDQDDQEDQDDQDDQGDLDDSSDESYESS